MSQKELDPTMSEEELLEAASEQGALEEDISGDPDPETPEEEQTAEPQGEETPEGDPKEETPEWEQYLKQFEESGLASQYPGGIPEMLKRVPETNKYLEKIRTENDEFRKTMIELIKEKEAPKPQLSQDELNERWLENPTEALDLSGVAKKDEVEQLRSRLEENERKQIFQDSANYIQQFDGLEDVAATWRTHNPMQPGKNAIWDTINNLISQNPGTENLPLNTQVSLFYKTAKALVDRSNAPQKPKVNQVSQEQKNAARTTQPGTSSGSLDYEKMSSEQLLKHVKDKGYYVA